MTWKPTLLEPPPGGLLLYRGPSRIDQGPIIAVLTLRSENSKTGPMLQTWVMRSDVDPFEALRRGLDESVCGTCQLRGDGTGKGRGCYVNLTHGPLGVWRGVQAGIYPVATDRLLSLWATGRPVRLGSYGDPAAVPIGVWTGLMAFAGAHTGYTRRWMYSCNDDYKSFCMASVFSAAERRQARSLGWRTYRVMRAGERPGRGEAICPASKEAGHKAMCFTCLACDGRARPGPHADIAIPLHGGPPARASATRTLASLPILTL